MQLLKTVGATTPSNHRSTLFQFVYHSAVVIWLAVITGLLFFLIAKRQSATVCCDDLSQKNADVDVQVYNFQLEIERMLLLYERALRSINQLRIEVDALREKQTAKRASIREKDLQLLAKRIIKREVEITTETKESSRNESTSVPCEKITHLQHEPCRRKAAGAEAEAEAEATTYQPNVNNGRIREEKRERRSTCGCHDNLSDPIYAEAPRHLEAKKLVKKSIKNTSDENQSLQIDESAEVAYGLGKKKVRFQRQRKMEESQLKGEHYNGNHEDNEGHTNHTNRLMSKWIRASWAKDNLTVFDAEDGTFTVKQPGLYYIYAQVYYSHVQDTCGYAIMKKSSQEQQDKRVAVCKLTDSLSRSGSGAARRQHDKRENTCFTAVLDWLLADDRLFITEEAGRTSVFTAGMSFFGLLRLVADN